MYMYVYSYMYAMTIEEKSATNLRERRCREGLEQGKDNGGMM